MNLGDASGSGGVNALGERMLQGAESQGLWGDAPSLIAKIIVEIVTLWQNTSSVCRSCVPFELYSMALRIKPWPFVYVSLEEKQRIDGAIYQKE